MNINRIFAFVVLMSLAVAVMAGSKVVAHRGYWQAPGSAQNSIRALVKADSVGCYASEFDVWITADGVLVVNHDADVNGVVIASSAAHEVLAQRLSNGEHVPTLDAYLATAATLPIRLVCELKVHDSRAQERKAVKDIMALVKKYGLEDRTDYITFSCDAFREFIRQAPESAGVYYLEGNYVPSQIRHMGGAGIDYYIGVLKKYPEWIDECHSLGMYVNVWTVNKPEDMHWCIDHGVDFITTNDPELLQSLLSGKVSDTPARAAAAAR